MRGMSAEKYSASMDDALLAEARAAAEAHGTTLSSWLAEAAADRLRLTALRELVDEWEAEHGAITTSELDALDRRVADARRRATQRARAANERTMQLEERADPGATGRARAAS
jgi:hypothetical protein